MAKTARLWSHRRRGIRVRGNDGLSWVVVVHNMVVVVVMVMGSDVVVWGASRMWMVVVRQVAILIRRLKFSNPFATHVVFQGTFNTPACIVSGMNR